MSWFLQNRNLKLLEPYDWKLSRTVLRGEGGSNASDLPGKALMSANMSEYIKYLFKTVRKYFGEAVVVTQEVDDIISSEIVKEAIINNSDCKILLDQRKYMNKFEHIQKLLGLTDKEKGQILSINQANHPGRFYREVWIGLGGTHSAVYATEVSEEEYLVFTTEESEKMEVQKLAGELGGNLELAVRRLAEEKRAEHKQVSTPK
ncbi:MULTISPECIES: TraG family conjugative transposon ATPase [unclassified Bacteroides]|uniref:TraG family conjugative transposon ATPase n=1 Tax=unclassified Bacteroides TaxID=2646097 RepID=UPI000E9A0BD6|nr:MULTISPECIES: TraG family conjugative transposon ATPase [unclassified Bacteroides]RGN59223.1 TraG family conjugative transposon ATPase [Bacteroides sp. OM05-10AA]RGQ65050.1 TraG family conjugative transposon ATPase [Bacteroides sp. AF27-33]